MSAGGICFGDKKRDSLFARSIRRVDEGCNPIIRTVTLKTK
jgi:hypothetical protein